MPTRTSSGSHVNGPSLSELEGGASADRVTALSASRFGRCRGLALDLDNLDLGAIADALADQFGGYEHLMLIDPHTGETVYLLLGQGLARTLIFTEGWDQFV